MTISSWTGTALVSLLLNSSVVAGQGVILIPMSSATIAEQGNMMNTEPFLFGGIGGGAATGEPPCRKRRLEPWRQSIREQCFVEANAHCRRQPEGRDLFEDLFERRKEEVLSGDQMTELEKEVDSFFKDLFLSNPLNSLSSEMFDGMLEFSLRAFDEAMVEESVPPPLVDAPTSGEEEEDDYIDEDEEDDYIDEIFETDRNIDDFSNIAYYADSQKSSEFVAAVTPEQTAENAMDVMVASLAARYAVEVDSDDQDWSSAGEEEDGEKNWSSSSSDLSSIRNLSELLFQVGNDLFVETHSRRRLMEEDGEINVDPHLQVKERLARRLTEYRTDLVFSPDGNTVMVYTTSSNFVPSASSSFPSTSFPSFGDARGLSFVSSPAAPPALGTGCSLVDDCLRSRFNNGDLEQGSGGGCHRAVGEFLLAVDHGSPDSPHYDEFASPVGITISHLALNLPKQNSQDNTCNAWNVFIAVTFLFSVLYLLDKFCAGEEEAEDDDEGDAAEFDYASLPEDDAGERLPVGEQRVFMGVPVQVV